MRAGPADGGALLGPESILGAPSGAPGLLRPWTETGRRRHPGRPCEKPPEAQWLFERSDQIGWVPITPSVVTSTPATGISTAQRTPTRLIV